MMKFAVENLSTEPKASSPLTDADFVARMVLLDEVLETNHEDEEAADPTQSEIVQNMMALQYQIDAGMYDVAYLDYYIRTTPGLKEMYGGSVKNFRANLKKAIAEGASMEGVVDGILGDWNVGPIGALIAYMRSNIPSVKEQIKLCREKLRNTSDSNIESRSQQNFIRVRSKYLPSVENFTKACDALTKALNTVASTPDAPFEKLAKMLSGTMYDVEGKLRGNQDTDLKYIGVRLLPTVTSCIIPFVGGAVSTGLKVAERFHFDPSKPVGTRGWNNRNAYQNGLDKLDTLVAALDKATAKLKNSDGNTEPAARFVRWASKEVVYLGRGLTTAIRKVYAGGVVRFVSNRVIH